MRRRLATIILAGLLTLAGAGVASADPGQAVPPGCESGAYLLTWENRGVDGHHWYDPLYPMFSYWNNYGYGYRYDPCYPLFSWANSYGEGYNGTATP